MHQATKSVPQPATGLKHFLATDSNQQVLVKPTICRVARQRTDEVPEEHLTYTTKCIYFVCRNPRPMAGVQDSIAHG